MGELVLRREDAIESATNKIIGIERKMREHVFHARKRVVTLKCLDQCWLTAFGKAQLLIESRAAEEGICKLLELDLL